eukprot:2547590-Alexandrium_andersonii.AAC.1
MVATKQAGRRAGGGSQGGLGGGTPGKMRVTRECKLALDTRSLNCVGTGMARKNSPRSSKGMPSARFSSQTPSLPTTQAGGRAGGTSRGGP